MGRTRKQRRQAHGSAWRWEQTDCWYYTLPGTKKRMALFDVSFLNDLCRYCGAMPWRN